MKTYSHLTGLALLAIGCTESTQPTQPEQRNAIQLAAASSTSQNVVVDKFVPDVPTVIAYDGKGVPVAGAVVTFSMAAGGGGTIEHSVDTTNSAGVAQIRLWRVGTKTSVKNVVTARLANGDSVVFTATVLPGPATKLVKLDGDNQIVQFSSAMRVNPRVLVTDQFDNPIPGQQVTFAVTRGTGSVTSPGVVTDSLGIATASGWTAGMEADQGLQVTAGGLSDSFYALALPSVPSCIQGLVTGPSITISQLSSADCVRDGQYYRTYYFKASAPGARSFEMRSSELDSYLELRDANSKLIASNDNFESSRDARMRVALPAGIYQVVAISRSGTSGSFAITVQNAQPVPDGCNGLFVVRGGKASGPHTPLICNGVPLGNTDLYRMHLDAGDTLVASLSDMWYDDYFNYDDYHIVITTESGDVLTASPSNPDAVIAEYRAPRDTDVVVRVTATSSVFPYSIFFN